VVAALLEEHRGRGLAHGTHPTPVNTKVKTPPTIAVELGLYGNVTQLLANHPDEAVGTPALDAAAAERPMMLGLPQGAASKATTDATGNPVIHIQPPR